MIPKRRSLTEAEIIAGYSVPFQPDLLALASRNAMILKWLRELSQKPLVSALIEREYAEHTGFPLDDVKGALEYVTDAPGLDWLWSRYEKDIKDADFLRRD